MPGQGSITKIIGPVVDVQFPPDALPSLRAALEIDSDRGTIVLEVAQHLGDSVVRSVAMAPTEGLRRGQSVRDTGGPITVPVGEATLGRILNVLGEPIDERGPVPTETRLPIHRSAPPLTEQSVEITLLETGIKVIDFLTPFPKGGKIGAIGGAGCGKTVPAVARRSCSAN